MNYVNTFIEIAADSKAAAGMTPKLRAGMPTVAGLEYEMISSRPYTCTQEDVQFHVHAVRSGLPPGMPKAALDKLRREFFAKPTACMRSSALAKTYGWGLHFNEHGGVALVSVSSPEYTRLARQTTVAHTRALAGSRPRRANTGP